MNTTIVVAFVILDMIVMVGVVFFIMSRRNSGSSGKNSVGDFNNAPPSPFESAFSSTTSSDGDEIQDLLRRGQKIEAIKIYRQRTGLGLREAKDAIEDMQRQMK